MKKFLHTRALPLLLCFTLTLGVVSYETPKAEAVVSETAILAGIACSFLASAGVSLAMDFATSGAMEQAVNGLLKAYAETDEAFQTMVELAASTGISAATGKLYIAKPLVEKLSGFVNWLISEKGLTEGGDAVEVVQSTGGVSVGSVQNCTSLGSAASDLFSVDFESSSSLIQLIGVSLNALIICVSVDYLYGLYFDSEGVFRVGMFTNPYGVVNSSLLGLFPLSDFQLIETAQFEMGSYTSYSGGYCFEADTFFSKSYAEASSSFVFNHVMAFQTPVVCRSGLYRASYGFVLFRKSSTDSAWGSTYNCYFGNLFNCSDGWVTPSSKAGFYSAVPSSVSFDTSTLSTSIPDGVTVPDTESMTAPNTYYVTNVNVSNASGKEDFYEKLLALTLENNLTATGEIADAEEGEIDDTQTGTGTESGTVVDEESKGFLAYIPQIFEQIKSIPSAIAEKIGELFAPDEELITEITDTFKAKFSFITALKQLGDDLLSMTPETEPPVIWIHLEDADSEYGYSYGGMVKALDLSWYQKYKADVDRIISGFLWLGFLWLLFKRAASIIRGGEMLTEYSNDLTRTYRESSTRENEAKFQNWLWKD